MSRIAPAPSSTTVKKRWSTPSSRNWKTAATFRGPEMTKVHRRFHLERPLDEEMMPRIADAHSIYGIMRIQVAGGDEIDVDYAASRLRTEDVGAVLKRRGLPVI